MRPAPLVTPLTTLLGIDYPIVQGGMIWASGHELAAAVSAAGGLGLLGAGSMDPPLLAAQLDKLAAAVPDRPWGVNLPLFFRHAEAMVELLIARRVRVVFTSGGSPRTYTARLKQAGALVVHVTATPALARKCQEAGVDAVVVEGVEAGGHNGRDELTTMVLVPQAADALSIPVIAAGGIADGRAMAAALALGAAGVQVGTRFAATRESSLHPAFKQAIVAAPLEGTALLLRKLIPVRTLKNAWARRVLAAEAAGAGEQELRALLGEKRARRGMFEGDLEEGELEIGQVAGAIRDLPGAATVVHELVRGCRATADGLARLGR